MNTKTKTTKAKPVAKSTKATKATRAAKAKAKADADYERELAALLSGREYVLIGQRTCKADGSPHSKYAPGDFRWPTRGWVEAPDWRPTDACGHGLHFVAVGAVGGEVVRDAGEEIITEPGNQRWQVVIARSADSVRIDDEKHKARRVFVVDLDGGQEAMSAWLNARGIAGHFVLLAGGYWATLTGGYWATLTGGDRATLTGGYWATLTGGYWATLTGGDRATLTGGYGATLTGGDRATLTGGDTLLARCGAGGVIVTTWTDRRGEKQVKAWTVGAGRDLKANTLYGIVDGVATEVK